MLSTEKLDDLADANGQKDQPKPTSSLVTWFCIISTLFCLVNTIGRYAYDAYYGPQLVFFARPVSDLPEGTYVVTNTSPSKQKDTPLYLLMGFVHEKMHVYLIRSESRLPDTFELKRSKGAIIIIERNIRVFVPPVNDTRPPEA